MINKVAFFDELAKIAIAVPTEEPPLEYETQEPPTTMPPGNRYVTKDRLKRALIAAGIIGAGAGVGTGIGSLVRNQILKIPPERVKPYMKYGPAVIGAGTALGGILLNEQRRRADEYIMGHPQQANAPEVQSA